MIRGILLITSLMLFGSGINLAYRDNVQGATACFVAGVMVLIFVFLSQFKRFKGLGITAEMWEQEMEDAERIANDFRNLSMLVAQPSITTMMRMGRWSSGVPRREAYDLVQRFDELLRTADAPEDQITEAKKDYYRFTKIDMMQVIIRPLSELLRAKVKLFASNKKAWEEADAKKDSLVEELSVSEDENIDRLIEKIRATDLLSHEEVESFLREHDENIEDIRYLDKRLDIRRPGIWFADDD